MSTAEAVAGLPGGDAFVALWTQVNGDSGAITDVATKLTAAADAADHRAQAISRRVGQVDEAWHGSAADAFANYMRRFGVAATELNAAIEKASATIAQTAEAVDQAKARLNSIASHVLDRADELRGLKDLPTTYLIWRIAVAAAVRDGCSQAQPVVDELVQHLDQAASALHSCASSGGWIAMTPTDSGTYLPPRGKPIQWSPEPHGLTPRGSVTPQSADPAPTSTSTGTSTGSSGTSGAPPSTPPSGDVKTWIEQARALLIKSGVPASEISEDDINMIIQHESGGNPHAENDWDSNAAAGHPSKGLMQTIDSTFNAYALPGHTDIWNPVDNICAGVRYALSRYGSLDNVPGVKAVHDGGSYVGY